VIRVGLIADTHGLARPELARAFAGVDLILHAGDVGGRKVLDALAKIAPVEAVFGTLKRSYGLTRMRYFSGPRNLVAYLLACMAFNLKRSHALTAA